VGVTSVNVFASGLEFWLIAQVLSHVWPKRASSFVNLMFPYLFTSNLLDTNKTARYVVLL
jgi:hypothetical protein